MAVGVEVKGFSQELDWARFCNICYDTWLAAGEPLKQTEDQRALQSLLRSAGFGSFAFGGVRHL